MTAWGVVAVCAVGGGIAGPLLERASRRVLRPAPAGVSSAAAGGLPASAAAGSAPAAKMSAAAGGLPASAAAGSAPAAALVGSLGAAAPETAAPGGTVAGTVVPPAGLGGAGATHEPHAVHPADVVIATLVMAASCALAALRLGAVPPLAAYCALFGGLVAISLADLQAGLVPRRLLYPTLGLVALGLVAASADAGAWHPLLDALIGGAVAFAVFYAIWWIYPKGMGFGDVRLAGLCGVALGFLGFPQLYIGFLAAFLFGALGGIVALARRGARRFPFAPALALGTAFGVLWGGWLGNLWLHPG